MNDLVYGMQRPVATLPQQYDTLPGQDVHSILLHADRFNRGAHALQRWSPDAKRCVDYVEGRQWREEDLRKLAKENRPALVINKIIPLVKTVLGFFINNQTEIKFMPGHTGVGTEEIAETLSHVEKQISEANQLPYVDTEAYMDGLMTGRGFIDDRLSFLENDLGETVTRAQDPFATYIDPDAESYDLNKTSNFIMTTQWTSLDEVEYYFGKKAMTLVQPWMQGGNFSGFPSSLYDGTEETTPWRRFGGDEDWNQGFYMTYFNNFWEWVDRQRKQIRLLDIQHYVRCRRWFFVDLETGDRSAVPDHWDGERVKKVLYWAQANGAPMVVQPRQARRLRHTIMIGDVLVYDRWSPYKTFTITPFFPYFRRGETRGMVHDLLGPQDEINKRRSARLNIINRASSGGWKVPKGSLTPTEKTKLEIEGSSAGYIMEYETRDGKLPPPEAIVPGIPPHAMQQMEDESEDDVKQISGVNDSLLGQIDAANASGRAVEARQRQGVMGLELFQQNWRRTKELQGRRHLELVQDHYTEERVIRARGERQKDQNTTIINERSATGIMNNVSLGTYSVVIDETPLSASFLDGQFNEMMRLKELGVPIPDDHLVEVTSLPRKAELTQLLAAARQTQIAGGAVPEAEGRGGAGALPDQNAVNSGLAGGPVI